MRYPSRLAGACALSLVAVLGLTACSDDGSKGAGTSSSSSTSSAGSAAPADLAATYLAPEEATPIGSADGEVAVSGGSKSPAHADVLSVSAGGGSTVLRWQLSAESPITLDAQALAPGSSQGDASGVELVAPSANLRMAPGYFEQKLYLRCVCPRKPQKIGPEPYQMSGIYPALPEDVTEVEVRIPGFAPISVPVSRD